MAQFRFVKDYYYFLGISTEASAEDIKKAHRKLSLKYHPDKNENDKFFEDRFREVQEAYETLINENSRKIYDQNFSLPRINNRNNLPPFIKTFSANKIRVKKGEEVIITWQTQNADVVKVMPFGLEKAYGERVFKINEFIEGKFQILCHANNSLTQKTAVKGITITEVFENDREKYRSEAEEKFKPQTKARNLRSDIPTYIRIVAAVIMMIILLIWIIKSIL